MKDNSNNPVTKGEFRLAIGNLRGDVDGLKTDVAVLKADVFVLKRDVADIKDNMVTKQDHDRLLTWMDEAMTEIRAYREERLLTGRQFLRMDDAIADHEKRICVLEKG